MSRAKKISVAAIFLLGGLSVIIAIIRLSVVITADLEDVTWYTSLDSWTAIEPAVEVLSVSLPVMAPFLRGRKALKELRSHFYSLFSQSKTSNASNDGKFRKIDKRPNTPIFVHGDNVKRGTSATIEHQANGFDDDIPLNAIKVVDQVDVR
ncbi:MAG: hypothetical protein Q9219_004437 [cf. Caloplaca sp. 3 TL-2023]